jgi:hypothetical protein
MSSHRHYGAPVAMALYTHGSGIPVLSINRRCPRPKKGGGLAQGGQGEFNTTRNQSPEYDYTLKKKLNTHTASPLLFRPTRLRSPLGTGNTE